MGKIPGEFLEPAESGLARIMGSSVKIATGGAAAYGLGKALESVFADSSGNKSGNVVSHLGMVGSAATAGGAGGSYEPPPVNAFRSTNDNYSNDNNSASLSGISKQLNSIIGLLSTIIVDNKNLYNLIKFKIVQDGKNARETSLETVHPDETDADFGGPYGMGSSSKGDMGALGGILAAGLMGGIGGGAGAEMAKSMKDMKEAGEKLLSGANLLKIAAIALGAFALLKGPGLFSKGGKFLGDIEKEEIMRQEAGGYAEFGGKAYKKSGFLGKVFKSEAVGEMATRAGHAIKAGGLKAARGGVMAGAFEAAEYATGMKEASDRNLAGSVGSIIGAGIGAFVPGGFLAEAAFMAGGEWLGTKAYDMYHEHQSAPNAAKPTVSVPTTKPTPSGKPVKGVGMTPNARKAMDFFMKHGWTEKQAAGLVGNLQQESGPNLDQMVQHNKDGSIGSHYGIAQWNKARQAAFFKYKGFDIHKSKLEDQLDFVNWELRTGWDHGSAGKALESQQSILGSSLSVQNKYEVAQNQDTDKRVADAYALSGTTRAGEVLNTASLPKTSSAAVVANQKATTQPSVPAAIAPKSVGKVPSTSDVPNPSASSIMREYQLYFTTAAA